MSGKRYQVTAAKEVVLSAGSIGTPKLLLLSGIGDLSTLHRLGIEALVEHSDVGQHLADQPLVPSYFFVNSTQTNDHIFRNVTLINQELQLWNETGMGLFADPSANHITFTRLPDNSPIFETVEDPSAGKLAAHTEILITVRILHSLLKLCDIVTNGGLFSFSFFLGWVCAIWGYASAGYRELYDSPHGGCIHYISLALPLLSRIPSDPLPSFF